MMYLFERAICFCSRALSKRASIILIYTHAVTPTEPVIELVFAYDTTVVLLLSLRRLENVFTLFF